MKLTLDAKEELSRAISEGLLFHCHLKGTIHQEDTVRVSKGVRDERSSSFLFF